MPLEGNGQVLLSDSPSWIFSGTWFNPERLLLDGYRGSHLVSASGGPLEPAKEAYTWPQILPDGKHLLHVRWDARTGHYRAHAVRLPDFTPAGDLLETDSRVMYAASVISPDKGYLLFIRAGNLLALPFDPGSLRTSGQAIPVANNVYFFFQNGCSELLRFGSRHPRISELCQSITTYVGRSDGTINCHHRSSKHQSEERPLISGWTELGDGDLRYRAWPAGSLDF